MKIEINGKKFEVREILNREVKALPKIVETDTKEEQEIKNDEVVKSETMLCTGLSSEEYDNLTRKEFLTLRLEIIKMNSPDSFQVPN